MVARDPCQAKGCVHPATHGIKLCVPPSGYPADEASAISMTYGLRLCLKHAEETNVDQFLDVPNGQGSTLRKDLIPGLAKMRGLTVPPDCDRAWIVPIRLNGETFQTLGRLTGRKPGGGA